MHRCSGIKPNGGRCERIVSTEQEYCYSHDPERASERRRNASKGGKVKANQELAQVKRDISAVIEGVLSRGIERSVGAVAFQGYNTLLKAVSVEMKVREVEELVERLEGLESALEQRKGGSRWGA